MNVITESLDLDVTRRSNIKIIHIKQCDKNSRRVRTSIYVEGVKQTISESGNTALINIRRPDAETGSYAATINNDGTVTATIPYFAGEIPGGVSASISILDGDDDIKLTTESFIIQVDRSDNSSDDISEDTDTDILLDLIAQTNAALDRADEFVDNTAENAERAETAAATAEHIADIVDVHKDGYYPSMTVGTSEQLIGEATTSDNSPYLLRKSAGSGLENNILIGGTVAWNQLAMVNNPEGSSNGVTWSTNDNIVTMSSDGTLTTDLYIPICQNTLRVVSGHKYAFFGAFQETLNFASGSMYITNSNANVICSQNGTIFQSNQSSDRKNITIVIKAGDSFANYKYHPQIFDLTAMFGTAIADYIYNLETATAGEGIQWIRDNDPKLLKWHPYDAGSLISVKPSAHKMVGFNQWDEEWEVGYISDATGMPVAGSSTIRPKDYIEVLPNTTYYIKSHDNSRIFFYDLNKNLLSLIYNSNNAAFTTPSEAYYIKFLFGTAYGITYNHDICINFSDPAKNGTYEPYEVHEYTLGSDELRGIPQLTDGKLSYDGDVKTADGQITRKYGIVDLGTLTWSKGNFLSSQGIVSFVKKPSTSSIKANIICGRYETYARNELISGGNAVGISIQDNGYIVVYDPSFADAASFKTAMSGVYLVYEATTPTIEQGTAYSPYQRVSADGTEEFVDERDVPVPVGHETQYCEVITKDEVSELKRIALASFATDTASGDIANFPDGADGIPVKSAEFKIDPIQDLNGYDSPWPAGGGENLLPPQTITGSMSGVTVSSNGDKVTLNGTASAYGQALSANTFTLDAGTYYLKIFVVSGSFTSGSVKYELRSIDGLTTYVATANGSEFTLEERTELKPRVIYGNGTVISNYTIQVMVVSGSAAPAAYSPYSNICPISGWTGANVTRAGKNLYNANALNTLSNSGITATVNNGEITFNGTATANAYFNVPNTGLVSGQYVFSFNNSVASDNVRVSFRTASGAYFSDVNASEVNKVVAISGEPNSVTLYVKSNTTLTNFVIKPQLELGSTATDYEPYQATTSHVAWPEAGTVYEGTLEYLGGERWRLTGTVGYADLGTLNWIRTSFISGKYGHLAYVTGIKPAERHDIAADLKCSDYKTFSGNLVYTGRIGISMWATEARIAVYDSTMEDLSGSDFKAAMNGVQLIYPLAAPQTYDLTADELRTLLGTNNIWADTGDSEVEYRADTKLYIDKKLSS